MRIPTRSLTAVVLMGSILHARPALTQALVLSDAECQGLRVRVAEYAKVSERVRLALVTFTGAPVPPAAPPKTAGSRADEIRGRLEQIPDARQQLEDQRLAALLTLEFARASQIQRKIEAIDRERSALEKELAALAAAPATPAPPQPVQPAQPVQPTGPDVDRIGCGDMPKAYEAAVKIRQSELGAREGQAGVLPLVSLKGPTSAQIARELAAQFAAWPEAATQVGLLDVDADGRLDAFVDVPAQNVFRLYRQRPDGTLGVEVFLLAGAAGGMAYGEMVRRLDEAIARRAGRTLLEILALRAAGPQRILAETAEFGRAHSQMLAGNFADASRVDGAAARSREFENFRGEKVRALEIIGPAPGGVTIRQVLVLSRAGDQESWEETTTSVRPVSYWRTDVELAASRETRTAAGALVGARSTTGPIRFSLDR